MNRNGKIYAKNITAEQRKWLQNYMNVTTFEPLFQDELSDGTMTFEQVRKKNLGWFEMWSKDAYQQAERGG